jgi:hypothetical protein
VLDDTQAGVRAHVERGTIAESEADTPSLVGGDQVFPQDVHTGVGSKFLSRPRDLPLRQPRADFAGSLLRRLGIGGEDRGGHNGRPQQTE